MKQLFLIIFLALLASTSAFAERSEGSIRKLTASDLSKMPTYELVSSITTFFMNERKDKTDYNLPTSFVNKMKQLADDEPRVAAHINEMLNGKKDSIEQNTTFYNMAKIQSELQSPVPNRNKTPENENASVVINSTIADLSEADHSVVIYLSGLPRYELVSAVTTLIYNKKKEGEQIVSSDSFLELMGALATIRKDVDEHIWEMLERNNMAKRKRTPRGGSFWRNLLFAETK